MREASRVSASCAVSAKLLMNDVRFSIVAETSS